MGETATLRFRILMDNAGRDDVLIEHGFSVWIEYLDKVLVFDTGQTERFIENARKMGCDLSQVDTLVLSHGHFDHTGGITALLGYNPRMRVVSHPAVLTHPRYSLHSGKPPRVISMSEEVRHSLQALPAAQYLTYTQPFELYPNLCFSGEIPRHHPLEDTGGPFYLDQAGTQVDTIPDDASLWFHTERGLIILTGCCHSGLINTVSYIQKITGEQRIVGIIGGFHLLNASPERLDATAAAISQWHPEFMIACHCTGLESIRYLRARTKVTITEGYCGKVFDTK